MDTRNYVYSLEEAFGATQAAGNRIQHPQEMQSTFAVTGSPSVGRKPRRKNQFSSQWVQVQLEESSTNLLRKEGPQWSQMAAGATWPGMDIDVDVEMGSVSYNGEKMDSYDTR